MSYANVWTPRETRLLFTRRKAAVGAKGKAATAVAKGKGKGGARAGKAAKGPEKKPAEEEPAVAPTRNFRLRAAAALRELEAALLEQAAESNQAAENEHSSFERKLGAALAARDLPMGDLMREWDEDGSGSVKKVKFRQKVRGDLKIKSDNPTIDAFFDRLDRSGQGTLDLVHDLGRVLSILLHKAGGASAEAERLRARAQERETRAKMTHDIADATEAWELRQAELAALVKARESVAQQLGALIIQKWGRDVTRKELSTILGKWDARGKKEVDRGEFRKGMIGMRVVESTFGGDISNLFDLLLANPATANAELQKLMLQQQQQAAKEEQQRQRSGSVAPGGRRGSIHPAALTASTPLQEGLSEQQLKDLQQAEEEALARAVPVAALGEWLSQCVKESGESADTQTQLEMDVTALRKTAGRQQHQLREVEEREDLAEEQMRQRAERANQVKTEEKERVNAMRAQVRRAREKKKRDERAAFEAKLITTRKSAAAKRLINLGIQLDGELAKAVQHKGKGLENVDDAEC